MAKRPRKLSSEQVQAARERFARAELTFAPPRKRFAERVQLVDAPGGKTLAYDGRGVFTSFQSREIADAWLAGVRSTI